MSTISRGVLTTKGLMSDIGECVTLSLGQWVSDSGNVRHTNGGEAMATRPQACCITHGSKIVLQANYSNLRSVLLVINLTT